LKEKGRTKPRPTGRTGKRKIGKKLENRGGRNQLISQDGGQEGSTRKHVKQGRDRIKKRKERTRNKKKKRRERNSGGGSVSEGHGRVAAKFP